jgi:hypothetical protein
VIGDISSYSLNHARRRPPETGLRYNNEEKVIKTLLKMETSGINKHSRKTVSYKLKYLSKNANLEKPEEVKTFIAKMTQADYYKHEIHPT